MRAHRLPVGIVVALLFLLVGVGRAPAPVAAPTPTAGAAPTDVSVPTFLADGAHLASGVVLRLAALGRGDARTTIDAVLPTDDGARVRYAHGNVTEWYLRQGGGIEQGITLASPPIGAGTLSLTIATPGAAVLVSEAGDAATLMLPDKTRWLYDGLHVTDATGQALSSRLVQDAGGGIGITVEDVGAVYPITVDPYIRVQTLVGPAGSINFGSAVAVSSDGSTMIVGAYGTNSYKGSAYVYTKSGTSYGTAVPLTNPGPNYSSFGYAVAISTDGGTLLVGAPDTDSSKGAAYIYTRNMGSYGMPVTLNDPVGVGSDSFGRSVGISGDGGTLLIGAYGTRSIKGIAYVYTLSGGSYGAPASVSATDGTNGDGFGVVVAISSDASTLLIGASGATSLAPKWQTGKAYVFTRVAGSYTPLVTLNDPLDTSADAFGIAVAVSGDGGVLVVGQYFVGGSANRYVYIYTRAAGTYGTPVALSDPMATSDDEFGRYVGVSGNGNTVFVGADGANFNAGVTHVYTKTGGSFPTTPTQTLTDPNGGGDTFGCAVSATNDATTLVIGAYGNGKANVYMLPPLALAPAVIGGSGPGTPYFQHFTASGGTGTGYVFSLAAGSNLPMGLTLSPTGVLSGTAPTVTGTYTFTVQVTDSAAAAASRAYTLIVAVPNATPAPRPLVPAPGMPDPIPPTHTPAPTVSGGIVPVPQPPRH